MPSLKRTEPSSTAPLQRQKEPTAKTQQKASQAEKPLPVVHAPNPKVQAEAHETQEKIRELIKLAKEQGYLTWDDLNEALPDGVNDP